MSWSINITGRDKAKLKAEVRRQQCKDETNNPHSGVPARAADLICSEIDRCRIVDLPTRVEGEPGRVGALVINCHGSWHEQGFTESLNITQIQLVE